MKERRSNDRTIIIMVMCGLFAVGLLALEVYDIADIDLNPGEGADDIPGFRIVIEWAKEIAVLASIVVGIAAGIRSFFK